MRNRTRLTTVGTRITVADTSWARLAGLLGKQRLDAGCGLLLKPSSGVHTLFMRFAIDVVGLSRDLRVLGLWHELVPYRMTGVSLRIHSMLELPAGQIRACRMEVGDQLEWVVEEAGD